MVSRGIKRGEIRKQLRDSGKLRLFEAKTVLDKICTQYERAGVGVLVGSEEGFAQMLREIADPPVCLFYQGSLPRIWPRAVAVVGSRQMSERGRRAIEGIVPGLVKAGVAIVSGLARGVDSFAHQVCLENGGLAVAVLPTAFDRVYPRENLILMGRIIASGGLVISEYPLGMPTRRENFLERNRLVSGLSDGVLVIEAAARSGSIATPNFALDQGREVWCYPAKAGEENSEGVLDLIEDGATPVTEASQILEDLG